MIKRLIALSVAPIAIVLATCGSAQAQTKPIGTDGRTERTARPGNSMPQFPGNVYEYLSERVRYPEAARKANIQGRVLLAFVVDKTGGIITRG